MAMEVKLRVGVLLVCTFFLAYLSLSHGEEVVEDSTKSVLFDQCVSLCQRHQGDISEYLACERSCELRKREGQGGGDDWDRERGRWSPRDPQERERRERERREQERREREREREWDERRREDERERAREWEGDEDFDDDNRRDPEGERERQRREQDRRERERERREHGGRNEKDSENKRDPEKEREEKQRREQQHREEERRERERKERERREHGGRSKEDSETRRDPEQEKHRREQERREEQRHEQKRREREHGGRNPRRGRWDEDERSQRNNPYHFPQHRLQSAHRSQEGQYRILERFNERTDLLRGIKNNRFTVLEARPNTFIVPNHVDAESVHFVVRGRATISLVWQEKREVRKESHNVEQGNVIRVPAGVTVYLINRDDNENLEIASLLQPVNNPDQFRAYFPAGNENPQSYYSVFSNDILEAALNAPRDELDRLFRQHGQGQGGAIRRASKEQLRSLSQSSSSAGGRRARSGPISLQNQRPTFSNKFGQFFEACPEEFHQLRDMDVFVSLVEMNQGALMVPHFNSRATVVVYVAEGSGRFEMGSPHVANQVGEREWHRRGSTARGDESTGRESEEEDYPYGESERGQEGRSRSRRGQIHRVSARLSQGDVFVIPAGHPIAIVANENEKLRLVGFGINGGNNKRNFLAGQENIMNQVDREAKELAFNVRGREADDIFRRQEESFFTEGPSGRGRQQSRPRRSSSSSSSEEGSGIRDPLSSILNLAGIL